MEAEELDDEPASDRVRPERIGKAWNNTSYCEKTRPWSVWGSDGGIYARPRWETKAQLQRVRARSGMDGGSCRLKARTKRYLKSPRQDGAHVVPAAIVNNLGRNCQMPQTLSIFNRSRSSVLLHY